MLKSARPPAHVLVRVAGIVVQIDCKRAGMSAVVPVTANMREHWSLTYLANGKKRTKPFSHASEDVISSTVFFQVDVPAVVG